ncbi:MAG: hypothetical protein M3238_02280 [Actinomycetota bacterium]|nr:hypothetical protein [Actinomycetota bacterium]
MDPVAEAKESEGIATFIIDWPVVALIGLVFGAFAPSERWWRSRAFGAGLFSAAVFTTTALISYALVPDWMWMYFLDPDDVTWSVPLIAAAYLFVYLLGFASAVSLKSLGRAALWLAGGGLAIMELAVVAITWDRYHLVGSRSQWLAGNAHELFATSPTGPVRTIGLLGPIFIAILAVSLFLTYRGKRRAPAADR